MNSAMLLRRSLHISSSLATKIIRKTVQNNKITIEGVAQPFTGLKLQDALPKSSGQDHNRKHCQSCPLCDLGTKVQYTDVLILRQFLDHNMKLLNRDATGICEQQQRHLSVVVDQAKTAGLIGPKKADQVFVAPHRWKKFNVYYEWPKRYTLLPNNNKI